MTNANEIVKMEGKGFIYENKEGTLILIPKNSYVRENCSKLEWGMHLRTSDVDIPIPYLNQAITPMRFNEYYQLNHRGEITQK